MINKTTLLFIAAVLVSNISLAASCDIELGCDNVTYIMITETVTLPAPPQKEDTIYAALVYLTKNKFNFNEIAEICQNGSVNIYIKGKYMQKIDVDKFISGAFAIVREKRNDAFDTANNICREKTDPDLRR